MIEKDKHEEKEGTQTEQGWWKGLPEFIKWQLKTVYLMIFKGQNLEWMWDFGVKKPLLKSCRQVARRDRRTGKMTYTVTASVRDTMTQKELFMLCPIEYIIIWILRLSAGTVYTIYCYFDKRYVDPDACPAFRHMIDKTGPFSEDKNDIRFETEEGKPNIEKGIDSV